MEVLERIRAAGTPSPRSGAGVQRQLRAGYAAANGMIFSRKSMIAAAIAKVTSARPRVLGRPSRPAVAELRHRLGLPTAELAVIGDDLGMGPGPGAHGRIAQRARAHRAQRPNRPAGPAVPEDRRPDAAVDGIADLLDWL